MDADPRLRALLRSTGAVRSFTAQPVADQTLHEILDDARFAPSGGNRQPWRVAVVRDREIRVALGAAMRPVWDEYANLVAAGYTPFTSVAPAPTVLSSTAAGHVPNDLLDDIAHVPVVLAVAADLSRIALMDGVLERPALTGGASIYPFCWSILLAARARDLGGVITTFASRVEPEVAPLLGMSEPWALAATMFLGYPTKRLTRLRRAPVEDFCSLDRFDGPVFDPT